MLGKGKQPLRHTHEIHGLDSMPQTEPVRSSAVVHDEHRAGTTSSSSSGELAGETLEGGKMDGRASEGDSEHFRADMSSQSPGLPNVASQRSSGADDHSSSITPPSARRNIPPPDDRSFPLLSASKPSSAVNPPHIAATAPLLPPHNVTVPNYSTSSSSSTTQYSMSPNDFLPLLHCPLCKPSALLDHPVTLRCGHTVCSKHIIPSPTSSPSLLASLLPSTNSHTPLRCPIPTCASLKSSARRIPVHPEAQVNVTFTPSTSSVLDLDHEHGDILRSDVTINKIISLLLRSERSFSNPSAAVSRRPASGEDEHSDSEDESEGDEHRPPLLEYAADLARDNPTLAIFNSDRSMSATTSTSVSVTPKTASNYPCLDTPSASSSRSRHTRSRSRSPSPERPTKRPRRTPRLSLDESTRIGRHGRRGSMNTGQGLNPSAKLEKELMMECTCEICFALMWQPVTTPCQHTFCAKCLHRSLDHSASCPLCRRPLPGDTFFQDQPCNKVILAIILRAFPDAYAARGAAIEEDEHREGLDTPVFVCQLSFPGMPVYLNFYEPRFRLMLRRCLETPYPCFGMIPPPHPFAPSSSSSSPQNTTSLSHEYGTMLKIHDVHMLPDGQMRVEAWGTHRFRILRKGELDGYVIAKVERVDDLEGVEDDDVTSLNSLISPGPNAVASPTPEGSGVSSSSSSNRDADKEDGGDGETGQHLGSVVTSSGEVSVPSPNSSRARSHAPTYEELIRVCHDFLTQLRNGTPWVVEDLNQRYVPMPEDPALLSFWLALLLPIDEHEKAKLLPIRSPKLRLRLVVHWIEQLNSQWSYINSYPLNAPTSQVVLWWLRRLVIKVLVWFIWPMVFPRPRLPPFRVGTAPAPPANGRETDAAPRPDILVDLEMRNRGRMDRRTLLRYAAYVVLVLIILRAQVTLRNRDGGLS